MTPKRVTSFRPEYALESGVRIRGRDGATMAMVSASCLFCVNVGLGHSECPESSLAGDLIDYRNRDIEL